MTEVHTFNDKQVLLAVVPRRSDNFSIYKNELYCFQGRNRTCEEISLGNDHDWDSSEIIGTAHWENGAPVLSFDPALLMRPHYENEGNYSHGDTIKEFVSSLASIGYYGINPLGEKPKETHYWEEVQLSDGRYDTIVHEKEYKEDLKLWQEAESRKLRVEDMLVLIEVSKA